MKKEIRIEKLEIKDEKLIEFDDFTDIQKSYITNLLDEKLSIQREKMMDYFQNLQLEMIRQFQMQFLEISDVIEEAVEQKKKKDFFEKYT